MRVQKIADSYVTLAVGDEVVFSVTSAYLLAGLQ